MPRSCTPSRSFCCRAPPPDTRVASRTQTPTSHTKIRSITSPPKQQTLPSLSGPPCLRNYYSVTEREPRFAEEFERGRALCAQQPMRSEARRASRASAQCVRKHINWQHSSACDHAPHPNTRTSRRTGKTDNAAGLYIYVEPKQSDILETSSSSLLHHLIWCTHNSTLLLLQDPRDDMQNTFIKNKWTIPITAYVTA